MSDKNDIMKPAPIPARLQRDEKILILTADNTEDLEFYYPFYRLTEEGYQVDVATIDGKAFKAKHGYECKQTKALKDLRAEDYALLYIPGGKAPAELRENADVLSFVKQFAASGKPIAAICHGPQVLVSADLVRGKKMAAYWEVAKEIEAAGGTFSDEALAVDGQFITARVPGDLHRHLCGVVNALQGTKADQRAA